LSRLPYSGSDLFLVDFAGLSATIAASWVLYRWVEAPSQEWSSRIRFGRAPSRSPQMSRAAASAD
jgi:peptidoglycan/LPS O-acetylase OafA/YrhL